MNLESNGREGTLDAERLRAGAGELINEAAKVSAEISVLLRSSAAAAA